MQHITKKISMEDAAARFNTTSLSRTISRAVDAGLIICKYADPVDDAEVNISADWALEVAGQDASLVFFVDGAEQVDAWAAEGRLYYREDELVGRYGNERETATMWYHGCPFARAWCLRENVPIRVL